MNPHLFPGGPQTACRTFIGPDTHGPPTGCSHLTSADHPHRAPVPDSSSAPPTELRSHSASVGAWSGNTEDCVSAECARSGTHAPNRAGLAAGNRFVPPVRFVWAKFVGCLAPRAPRSTAR